MKKEYRGIALITLFFGILLCCSPKLFAQNYGLKFSGQEVTLDKRTELNLTPDNYLNFKNEFEISFEYKAIRTVTNRNVGLFGYIFRIINQENINVDLLVSPVPKIDLNIVLGKSNSIVRTNFPQNAVNSWIELRIKFILSEDRLLFSTPDSTYVMEDVGFKRRDAFKIIFGANDMTNFKTSDVPSMYIKDIKISEQGKVKYYWPLDEIENNVATDHINGYEATVINPSWLNHNFQIWQPLYENEISGRVMITTDAQQGRIFMVSEEELLIYSVGENATQKVTIKNKLQLPTTGYRTIYNSLQNNIYCYFVEKAPSFSLDIATGNWIKIDSELDYKYRYQQHNSYFNPSDNSIYVFGGYGQYMYNNEIRKIDLSTNTREDLLTNDSIFHPRYLAGLGALNDTIYILGGYGSKSGNQLINPQSYYDLIGYSINENSLFYKFEIPRIIDDMTVGNTMWIDELTRNYYALVFSKNRFDNYLQLIQGNLDAPNIILAGDSIPFKFLDIQSYAGLSYMPQQKKLFAYTSFITDSATTQVDIYSINYPPNKAQAEYEIYHESNNDWYLYLALACTGISLALFWVYRKRKKRKTKGANETDGQIPNDGTGIDIYDPISSDPRYHIVFFGGFQVFNKNFVDITNKFSPVLKELFLLIYLYTFKDNKGISTEKITEVLWHDKSEKSAQNNRAVNIKKLRTVLSELGTCELTKATGYWKSLFNEAEITSDYVEFLHLTSSKANLTKHKINQLLDITQKGAFLLNVQYKWLDKFKAEVSDAIIDTLLYYAESCDIKNEADFIIHLSDSIFIFDATNEDAMKLKCCAEFFMGKHSHAKATYEKFCEEFLATYGQEYELSFTHILKIDD